MMLTRTRPTGASLLAKIFYLFAVSFTVACIASFVSADAFAQTVSFNPAQVVASGLGSPEGMTFDSAGDLYIADFDNNRIVKVSAGGGVPTTVVSGLNNPTGVQVDGSGNLYIADYGSNRVLKVAAGGGTPVPIPINVNNVAANEPTDVVFDSLGNLYVADLGNSRIVKISAGGGVQTTVGSGFSMPYHLAIDLQNNLYVADYNAPAVFKVPTNGDAQTKINTGSSFPTAVAVDKFGNLYVNDVGNGNNNIIEIPANGANKVTFRPTADGVLLNGPDALAVDVTGALYIADTSNNRVLRYEAPVDFGASPVGVPTATQTLAFSVTGTVTLGKVAVVTQGTSGLDFNNAGGGTCVAGSSYNNGSTCTVNVSFTPFAPGSRMGAVVLYDNASPIPNVLATGYVAGSGTGPVAVFSNGAQFAAEAVDAASGLAIDNAGNLYAGSSTGIITKQAPGGTPVTVYNSGVAASPFFTVDGAGNLLVSMEGQPLVKVPAGGGTPLTIGNYETANANGIAVDGAGNIYIATAGTSITELPANGSAAISIGTGFGLADAVAVDGAGNLYVTDVKKSNVVRIAQGGTQTIVASGLNGPYGVAVDSVGNVYIADVYLTSVMEYAPNGTLLAQIGSFPSGSLSGVALDPAGNVFTVSFSVKEVTEVQRSVAAPLTFAAQVVGTSSSPQTIAVSNAGNSSLNLASLTASGNALVDSGSTCTAGLAVPASGSCNLGVDFAPLSVGSSLTGAITLADNAVNTPQSVSLTGSSPTKITTATVLSVSPGLSVNAGQTVQLTATVSPYTSGTVTAGGSVTFYNGGAALSTVVLSNGQAVLSLNNLPVASNTITATYSGDTNFATSSAAGQTVVVNKGSQTITFNSIPAQVAGGSVALTATASSGLAVSFSSLTPTVCTVSGATAKLLVAGTCSVQASQAGNAQYAAAPSITQSFNVTTSSNFTITPLPASEVVYRGQVAAFLLELKSVNKFNGNVKLTCSGGPTGSECGDFPQTVHVNGTAWAVSGILFPKTTTPGTYTLTFTGTSGSLVNTTTAKFLVK